MKRPAALWALLALGLAVYRWRAQNSIAPPMHPEAHDTPGRRRSLRRHSLGRGAAEADPGDVVEIERVAADGTAQRVGDVPPSDGPRRRTDRRRRAPRVRWTQALAYHWRLTVRRGELSSAATAIAATGDRVGAALPSCAQRNVLVIPAFVIALFALVNIILAQRGDASFHIRRLAPVDAMGTRRSDGPPEMGRSVLYVPGIEEVDDIQTIASMLILERVAEKTATYDASRSRCRRAHVVLRAGHVWRTRW